LTDTLLEAASPNVFSWPGQQPQPLSPEPRKEGVLGDKGTRLPHRESPCVASPMRLPPLFILLCPKELGSIFFKGVLYFKTLTY